MRVRTSLLVRMLQNPKLQAIALDFIRLDSAHRISSQLGYKVQEGLFKGQELNSVSTWDEIGSLLPKLIGTYEQELQTEITKLGNFETLVNVGAADGYYGIGLLNSKICNQVIFFESNLASRNQIKQNTEINKHKIQIYGEANSDNLIDCLKNLDKAKTLIILDIEGGEFDLLNHEVVANLCETTLIVEIHSFMDTRFNDFELENKLKKFFNISKVTNNLRKIPNLPQIMNLSDNLRWLLVSEGRQQQMEWWICTPKGKNAA